jgi:YegS/Rv2252/BmrU family lipid kinase
MKLAVVKRVFDSVGVRYTGAMTNRQGHAMQLARLAVRGGCSAVVVIGGDGTFLEALNGVLNPYEPDTAAQVAGRVAMGLVQAGRGSDFGRSAGIPSDVRAACERLVAGRTQTVDVGHVSFLSLAGKIRSRFFANAAGVGFDAEVALRANAGSRMLGGTIPYLTSLVRTLGRYRNKRVRVRLDGRHEWQGRINSLIVANGQYFGGGMNIAPDASLSDGMLDVVTLGNLGKLDLLINVPRVYDGSHVTHPKVSITRARCVEVTSPERLLLQADGEVLGKAPVTFSVVEQALRLIV